MGRANEQSIYSFVSMVSSHSIAKSLIHAISKEVCIFSQIAIAGKGYNI